jgi:hypothetical protein
VIIVHVTGVQTCALPISEVATLTGRSRRELYRHALALRESSRHDPAD